MKEAWSSPGGGSGMAGDFGRYFRVNVLFFFAASSCEASSSLFTPFLGGVNALARMRACMHATLPMRIHSI